MANAFVRRYANGGRAAALAAAQADADAIHKLMGGDRLETGAVGVGPAARRWLAENGPPMTMGYTTPGIVPDDPDDPDAGGEVVLVVADEVETALAADDARGAKRLTGAERALVAQAIAGRVARAVRKA